MEITWPQIILWTWNLDQRCKIMISKDLSDKFLIFWFFGPFQPFFGQNCPKWPENQKIKNLSDRSLETIILHLWSNFWVQRMIWGQVISILAIFQTSPLKFCLWKTAIFATVDARYLDNGSSFFNSIKRGSSCSLASARYVN